MTAEDCTASHVLKRYSLPPLFPFPRASYWQVTWHPTESISSAGGVFYPELQTVIIRAEPASEDSHSWWPARGAVPWLLWARPTPFLEASKQLAIMTLALHWGILQPLGLHGPPFWELPAWMAEPSNSVTAVNSIGGSEEEEEEEDAGVPDGEDAEAVQSWELESVKLCEDERSDLDDAGADDAISSDSDVGMDTG